jgi:predicted nucleic acid-binding protein
MADGQIAAIAAVHGFTVATRDTAPFVAAGVPVVNPWEMRVHEEAPEWK